MRRTDSIIRLALVPMLALGGMSGIACAQDEAVTLKTGLTEARTVRYEVRQQYETLQTTNGEESELTVEQHALLDLVVESLDEAGNAVVRIEPLTYSARLVNAEGPISLAFDLDTPRADGAERATGVLGLEQSLALAPMRATLRADGTVIRVTGLDEPMAMAQTLAEIEPNLVTFFDPDRLSDLLNAIYSADNGIGSHEKGDQWVATKRVALGGSGTLLAKTETTLSTVEGAFIALTGVFSLTLEDPAVASDSVPSLKVGKNGGQIITQWDLEEGGLVQRMANLNVELTVTMGEELRQETVSKSMTNVRRLPREAE